MASYESACNALNSGLIVRRQAWKENNHAVVGVKIGGTESGYAVVIRSDGTLHGEDNLILRYIATVEDQAATDWEYKDFSAILVPRDKRKLQ